jgi:hypothetical protein
MGTNGKVVKLPDGRLTKFQRRILGELGRTSQMSNEEMLDIILLDHYVRSVLGTGSGADGWDTILTVVDSAVAESEVVDGLPGKHRAAHHGAH